MKNQIDFSGLGIPTEDWSDGSVCSWVVFALLPEIKKERGFECACELIVAAKYGEIRELYAAALLKSDYGKHVVDVRLKESHMHFSDQRVRAALEGVSSFARSGGATFSSRLRLKRNLNTPVLIKT